MNKEDKKLRGILYLSPYKTLFITVLVALGVTFFTEITNRRSLIEAIVFAFTKPHLFIFNLFIIFFVLSFSLLFKKRKVWLIFLSTLWVAFGVTDFIMRSFRVTPFAATDFALLESVWGIMFLYLSVWQMILIAAAILAAIAGIIVLAVKMRKEKVDFKIAACSIAASAILVFGISSVYHQVGVIPDHFGNLPDAYDGYGFAYCYTIGLFDRGIDEPDDYSKENVEDILNSIGASAEKDNETKPNIIFLQLESFFDVNYINGVTFSENPVPNFTALKEKYSNGFLSVPSIGSGTANTEFEVLSGMSLDFFGTAEYPYKTILQNSTCETIAYNLKEQGYTAHAIHNHTGTFYDRNTVYANLGFDTFTSLEYMQGTEQNEIGWAKDAVLTGEILKSIDSTAGQDFVYAISVQAHGRYPREPLGTAERIKVYGIDYAGLNVAYEYFVSQLYETDAFVGDLISALAERSEPYIVVMFGDHLPSLDITEEQLRAGDLYDTEYVIWSNIGIERQVKDLETYQLSAYVMQLAGFSNGIFTKLHQNYRSNENYLSALEMLEYDVLYGDYDAYNGKQKYHPTNIKMGALDIKVTSAHSEEGFVIIRGENFTEYSVIILDGKRIKTEFIDSATLKTVEPVLDAGEPLPEKISVAQITKNSEIIGEVIYK
ncbi:MAG: LTA synthase family protein [Ruminococcaceae bacterium]|nr:LTA synthase family protein [Oscillospiraceae bacterium]